MPELSPAQESVISAFAQRLDRHTYTVELTEAPGVGTAWLIRRDGEEHLVLPEQEMAAGMCELLNEAVSYDRDRRRIAYGHHREAMVAAVEAAIERPDKRCIRMHVERLPHWAARAVMGVVDGWFT